MRRSPLYEQTSGAVIYDLREQYSGSTLTCTVKVMMEVSWVGEGGDIDAPIKGVLDCLERAGVLHNDKQVTELHVEKMMQQDEGKIDVWIEPTQVNW